MFCKDNIELINFFKKNETPHAIINLILNKNIESFNACETSLYTSAFTNDISIMADADYIFVTLPSIAQKDFADKLLKNLSIGGLKG